MTRDEIEEKAIEAAAIAVAIADDEDPPPAKFDHPAISDWSEHVARAAIAAYEAAMWQTMENAPEGVNVLVQYSEKLPKVFPRVVIAGKFGENWVFQSRSSRGYSPEYGPTHWCPLPKPPGSKP